THEGQKGDAHAIVGWHWTWSLSGTGPWRSRKSRCIATEKCLASGRAVKAAVIVEVIIKMASSRLLIGLGAVASLIAYSRTYSVFELLADEQQNWRTAP
ncbi:MAG: hypothetical protein QF707_07185, partial [Candidatus Poseidoniaceae archaeon]|nr:hypothetical protein [Candidatus Poseidoniaceae archaeon]